jgi:hypothetical protein
MGIYDRDWYRNEEKNFPHNADSNKKISKEDAEKLKRMVEGNTASNQSKRSFANEPPKVDLKYKREFIVTPAWNYGNTEAPRNDSTKKQSKHNRARAKKEKVYKVKVVRKKKSDAVRAVFMFIFLILAMVIFREKLLDIIRAKMPQTRTYTYTPYTYKPLPTTPKPIINTTKAQQTQKEYRLVGHITNDLSPILEEISKTLNYNDVDGIKNWVFSETISDSRLGSEIRKMRSIKTVNDQNDDGIINCQDFAILFYKLAVAEGFDVKIMSNSELTHAFNAVRRIDDTWETIEPQAGKGGKIIMKNAWKNYDSTFDEEATNRYRKYL